MLDPMQIYADPKVGQPSPEEADRIRKEILRLHRIPEVDRYIAKAGEESRSLPIVRVYHTTIMQVHANMGLLLLYGFVRACYEYFREIFSLRLPESLKGESRQWQATIKRALVQLRPKYIKHSVYKICELIYIHEYFDHHKYTGKLIQDKNIGKIQVYRAEDNMPEILLPMIGEIEDNQPDHPLVLYLKVQMLSRKGSLDEDGRYQIYSSIYNKNNIDRLPFLNRLWILRDLYCYMINKNNKKAADRYLNDMVQLMIKTWNIYPTQHFFVFNIERQLASDPQHSKLLKIIHEIKQNNTR